MKYGAHAFAVYSASLAGHLDVTTEKIEKYALSWKRPGNKKAFDCLREFIQNGRINATLSNQRHAVDFLIANHI